MFLIGIAGAPLYVLGVAYIDESVKKKIAPIYIGFFGSSGTVGKSISCTRNTTTEQPSVSCEKSACQSVRTLLNAAGFLQVFRFPPVVTLDQ